MTFDRIVSVGMLEHVSRDNYPLFFKNIDKVLNKKGIVLLHYISGRQEHDGDPWIKKYIFLGVMVLSLWEMISCGSADGFYILDVENLRLHQILFTKGINNDLPMTRWY